MLEILYKVMFRQFRRHPVTYSIQIIGLVLGICGLWFVALLLRHELTYDTHHTRAKQIYRATITEDDRNASSHFARIWDSEQIPELAAYYPAVESYVRLMPIKGGVIRYLKRYVNIDQAFICDSTIFDLFDIPLLIGNPIEALDQPGSVIISQSFAQKTFGSSNPIGEQISIPMGQYFDEEVKLTVTAVMADFPQKSHLHPELLATRSTGPSGWAFCYLLLSKNARTQDITAHYPQFWQERGGNEDLAKRELHLQNVQSIHLQSNKLREIEPNGGMSNVYFLLIAGLVLFIISLSNFTGLSRGISGYHKRFIDVSQFIGGPVTVRSVYGVLESMSLLVVAILIAVGILLVSHNWVVSCYGIDLLRGNVSLIAIVGVSYMFLCMVSTLLTTRHNELQSSLVRPQSRRLGSMAQRAAAITQYALIMVLIVAVIVIYRQIQFGLQSGIGGDKRNTLLIESAHSEVQTQFGTFKNELLKKNSISIVSAMMDAPGGESNDRMNFKLEAGMDERLSEEASDIGVQPCDYSVLELFDLQLLEGNNFSKKNADTEGSGEYIINESAMRHLGFSEPEQAIGKAFQLLSPVPGHVYIPKGRIIAVVKDFHLSSIQKRIVPLVLFKRENIWLPSILIRGKNTEELEKIVQDIQEVWSRLFPEFTMTIEPLNVVYDRLYRREKLQSLLLAIFAGVSMFLSALGLLGMTLVQMQRSVKQIGIRKVNGAQVKQILALYVKRYIQMLIFAFSIASPLAFVIMSRWLDNFAYKTALHGWIFWASGATVTTISLSIVCWQVFLTARANPVHSLRCE